MKNRSLHLCFKKTENKFEQQQKFQTAASRIYIDVDNHLSAPFACSEILPFKIRIIFDQTRIATLLFHFWQPHFLLPYPFRRAHKQFRTTSAWHSWNNQPVSPEAILYIKNFLPIPVAFASQCRPTDLPPRQEQSLIPLGDINFISRATDWTF